MQKVKDLQILALLCFAECAPIAQSARSSIEDKHTNWVSAQWSKMRSEIRHKSKESIVFFKENEKESRILKHELE